MIRPLDPASRARLLQLWERTVAHVGQLRHEGRRGKVVLEISVGPGGSVEQSSRVQPPWEFPCD